MANSFGEFLFSQSWVRIIRSLLLSSQGRSHRELVDLTELSPAGVQDVLRRLKEVKVVKQQPQGNRIIYSLVLEDQQIALLDELITYENNFLIKQRAKEYSRRYPETTGWIDETIETWRLGKKSLNKKPRDTT